MSTARAWSSINNGHKGFDGDLEEGQSFFVVGYDRSNRASIMAARDMAKHAAYAVTTMIEDDLRKVTNTETTAAPPTKINTFVTNTYPTKETSK